MEKKKCGQCGLVNWPGVMECVRCGAFVSDKQELVRRNPYENGSGSEEFNPIRLVAVLAVVMVCGIGAYIAFSASDPPKQAAAPPVGQYVMPPEERRKMFEALAEADKKEHQRMEQIRNAYDAPPMSPDKFKMTPESLTNMRKAACSEGVKNMGPC